jgi:hypothetical protein
MNGLFLKRTPSMASLIAALDQSVTRIGISGVRYTRRQLYYEFCRTLLPFAQVVASWSSVAAVGSASALMAWRRSRPLWSGLTGTGIQIAVPSLVRRLPFTLTPPVTDALFDEALRAYRARYGEPPGLLPDNPAPWRAIDGREPDLYDYGLAYALVCQDASIARMLRANFLHMEMACAILALEEATPLPDALVAMLIRASMPWVLLVHDASQSGLRWSTHAAGLLDVPRGFRIRALGLRPRHALQRHLFALRHAADTGELPASLNLIERLWLCAGYQAELAALPPVALLRALRRATRPTPRRDPWWSGFRRWRASGYMSWTA